MIPCTPRFPPAPAVLLAALILALMTPAAAADRDDPVIVRGELARLARQAYDYACRNSNRNVFRSSNHFHPTRNVFRSSNHYKKKLAASFDGYPLRTIVHYTEGWNDEARRRSYSFAHHRRHPAGPVGPRPGWGTFDFGYEYASPELFADEPDAPARAAAPALRPKPRSRSEIEMVEIRVEPRTPTQRAILQHITLPDGSVKTIITSEPIPATVDDAWGLLDRGNHTEAADLFARHSLDPARGIEATVGYALAAALAGDDPAAAAAIRRARAADPDAFDHVALPLESTAAISEVHRRCAARAQSDANARDAAVIASACRSLLRRND